MVNSHLHKVRKDVTVSCFRKNKCSDSKSRLCYQPLGKYRRSLLMCWMTHKSELFGNMLICVFLGPVVLIASYY